MVVQFLLASLLNEQNSLLKETSNKLESNSQKLDFHTEKLETIHECLKSKQKKSKQKKILRDGLNFEMYSKIIDLKIKKREKSLNYYRFRLAITL